MRKRFSLIVEFKDRARCEFIFGEDEAPRSVRRALVFLICRAQEFAERLVLLS